MSFISIESVKTSAKIHIVSTLHNIIVICISYASFFRSKSTVSIFIQSVFLSTLFRVYYEFLTTTELATGDDLSVLVTLRFNRASNNLIGRSNIVRSSSTVMGFRLASVKSSSSTS